MELVREKPKAKKPKKKSSVLSAQEMTKIHSHEKSKVLCSPISDEKVSNEKNQKNSVLKSDVQESSILKLDIENSSNSDHINLIEDNASLNSNHCSQSVCDNLKNQSEIFKSCTEHNISDNNLETMKTEGQMGEPVCLETEVDKLKLKADIISKIRESVKISEMDNKSEHPACVEKAATSDEVIVKNVYPDLKSIEHCKRIESIASTQTLVKTYADEYLSKTHHEAMKRYHEFLMAESFPKENYPLFDLVKEFRNSRKKATEAHTKVKSLNSKLKREKNNLWKPIEKQVSSKGRCEDGNVVTITHNYVIQELNEKKFKDIIELARDLEQVILSNAFYSYSDQLSTLKIEQYVYNVINYMATCEYSTAPPNEHFNKIDILKKCISILFYFQRQSTGDKGFLEKCQQWLHYLVPMLLQNTGDSADYLFIVNQVIRCPSGIKTWASQLIQIPCSGPCSKDVKDNFSCKCLYYTLLLLYLILNPAPDREFFLKNVKNNLCTDSSDGSFTLLDSEGEEEEIFEMTRNWTTEDIISLLNQIPITSMYEHVLMENKDGQMVSRPTTEESILRMFAFSTALVNILFSGVGNYCNESFSTVVELICTVIRHVICYVTDNWMQNMTSYFLAKSALQAEYDRFIFHAIFSFFSFQKLGVWSFLSSLPYKCVSNKMLWNILWIFHAPIVTYEENVYLTKDVDLKLQDPHIISEFVEKVKSMDQRDQLYLLSAYQSIILSSSGEEKLLCFVVREIFEVAFVENSLHHLSKESTIALVSIIEKYPQLITVLLKEVQKQEDAVMEFSTGMFQELNLMKWVPTIEDITIITDCLLSTPLSSPLNYLVRMLVAKMNFDFSKEGQLVLPIELHREIAILILRSYMKFDSNGNEWSVSKGLNQMLQFATIRSSTRGDEGFVPWAWNVLFSLKLHALDEKYPQWVQIYDGFLELETVPDPYDQLWLQPLLQGYEEKHPVACYLFLVMTNIGHDVHKLMKEGVQCLTALVEHQQYLATIHTLYYILPFCVKKSEELLSNSEFINVMSDLIIADMSLLSNMRGEAVVGAVLHKIAAMIKHQISQASALTVECATPLLTLWLNILLKVLSVQETKNYNLKDAAKQVYFLLDVVMRIACADSYTRNRVTDLLYTFGNPLLAPVSSPKPSFFGKWFNYNTETYTILKKHTLPDYPWLAWFVLRAETKQKHVQDLWYHVAKEIGKDPTLTPSATLKKSCAMLKINEPTLESLPIYRWGTQILQSKLNHPALPLLYQQFFYYFFERVIIYEEQEPKSLGLYYFSNGSESQFLKKLKQRAQDASEYYRQRLHIPKEQMEERNEDSSNDSNVNKFSEKMARENILFCELCKIFRAFYVWIDDKNLHLPNVCLSALDPKYLSERLKLILDNDQREWFELVSIDHLKEELDLKLHSYIRSTSYPLNTPNSLEQKDESLCEKISRHLNNNKTAKPLPCNITVDPPVQQIEDGAISSPNVLVQLIESNQSIIFEKAKSFTQLASRLKQLNDEYKTLAPDEIIVEDQQIVRRKHCHKGVNCQGPATFRLKVQKYSTNDRIQAKLENNQVEHRIIQDQLLNLPVVQLCYASIHIESYIQALSMKLRTSKGEEAVKFRKLGIALFYHQIKSLDKVITSVKSYSPSRNFFATSIESLGNAFICNQEDQLCDLAKSILKYSEAGELAFDLFNPNIASIPVFLDIYKIITSEVKQSSLNTIFVLLNKIDLQYILKVKGTNFAERQELFQRVCDVLFLCGSDPPQELQMVHDVLRDHYRIILGWMFPELYENAVSFLLNGMETGQLSINSWYDTFSCFGCSSLNDESCLQDIENALKTFAENLLLPPDQQIFVSSQPININEVQLTLNRLHEKCLNKRESQNLYQAYKMHVKSYGIFISLLAHSMLSFLNDDIGVHGLSQRQILNISQLWKSLHLAFYPWLHPTIKDTCFVFPWSSEHINEAKSMFQIFTVCLANFHEKLLGYNCEKCILSYVWEFYVQNYVTPDIRHFSVNLCHSEFLNLPWDQFYPEAKDIEGMCTVLQSNLPESKEFLAKISLRIPWMEVMKNISLTKSPEYVRKTLGTLGKLLIISARWDLSLTKINPHRNNLKALEELSWHFLSLGDVEGLLNLHYSTSDPAELLKEEQANSPDLFILQFLKIVCCMSVTSSDISEHVHSNTKRLLYLHKYLSALSNCISSKNDMLQKSEKFKKLLPSLLIDIEKIISKDVKPEEQMSHALPLVREVIGFLNNISDPMLETLAIDSVVSWLESKPLSPLLLPCLQTACQCLTQMTNAVVIAESCITARFKTELQDPSDAQSIWDLISLSFQVPLSMTEEFIRACIMKNAFLTLYCHIQTKMSKSSSPENRKLLLVNVIDWIRRCEIKSNEEAKCLLLWDKVLELSVTLAFEDNLQVVKRALSSFCNDISVLGEDKSSDGILGAVGFGRASNLSVNFRFLCRIVVAFILLQMPDNASIRLEPMASGFMVVNGGTRVVPKPTEPSPSPAAIKALDNCKILLKNKPYSALKDLVNSGIEYILDPRNCLIQSRVFLKNYALHVFPKQSYLYALGC